MKSVLPYLTSPIRHAALHYRQKIGVNCSLPHHLSTWALLVVVALLPVNRVVADAASAGSDPSGSGSGSGSGSAPAFFSSAGSTGLGDSHDPEHVHHASKSLQIDGAININAASPALLATRLKGIGPAKAEAIVQYREQHGAFETVDALVNVKGIGPKTLAKLRPQIVAGVFTQPAKGESLAEKEAVARAAVQAIVKRSNELSNQAKSHQ